MFLLLNPPGSVVNLICCLSPCIFQEGSNEDWSLVKWGFHIDDGKGIGPNAGTTISRKKKSMIVEADLDTWQLAIDFLVEGLLRCYILSELYQKIDQVQGCSVQYSHSNQPIQQNLGSQKMRDVRQFSHLLWCLFTSRLHGRYGNLVELL